MIIAVTFGTVISGAFIGKSSRYQFVLLPSATVAIIAAGLLFTWNRDTTTGQWIGYQILAGAGYGAAFQIPVIVV